MEMNMKPTTETIGTIAGSTTLNSGQPGTKQYVNGPEKAVNGDRGDVNPVQRMWSNSPLESILGQKQAD